LCSNEATDYAGGKISEVSEVSAEESAWPRGWGVGHGDYNLIV